VGSIFKKYYLLEYSEYT